MQAPTELPLRDIHLPEPIGWWPLAPGWWLLALLIVSLLAGFWLYRRYTKQQRQRQRVLHALQTELQQIRQDLEQHGHDDTLQQLSVLLRRACLSFFPRADVASLTGEAWLQFVASKSGMHFDESVQRSLTVDIYRAHNDSSSESVMQVIDALEAQLPALLQAASR